MCGAVDKYVDFVQTFWLVPWIFLPACCIGMKWNEKITLFCFCHIPANRNISLVQLLVRIGFPIICQGNPAGRPGHIAVNPICVFQFLLQCFSDFQGKLGFWIRILPVFTFLVVVIVSGTIMPRINTDFYICTKNCVFVRFIPVCLPSCINCCIRCADFVLKLLGCGRFQLVRICICRTPGLTVWLYLCKGFPCSCSFAVFCATSHDIIVFYGSIICWCPRQFYGFGRCLAGFWNNGMYRFRRFGCRYGICTVKQACHHTQCQQTSGNLLFYHILYHAADLRLFPFFSIIFQFLIFLLLLAEFCHNLVDDAAVCFSF